MTDAITRVRAAIAIRDAAFEAIETNKRCDYTDDDLHELTSALIDAAPEMLRAQDEIDRLRAALVNSDAGMQTLRGQYDAECQRGGKLKDQRERLREELKIVSSHAYGHNCRPTLEVEALLKETAE